MKHWILNTLDMTVNGSNYKDRKAARTEPEDNNGIGVSTAWTDDLGYETALLDKNGAQPVERYPNLKSALIGHDKWVEKAKTIKKVLKLGMPGWIDDVEITLERV